MSSALDDSPAEIRRYRAKIEKRLSSLADDGQRARFLTHELLSVIARYERLCDTHLAMMAEIRRAGLLGKSSADK